MIERQRIKLIAQRPGLHEVLLDGVAVGVVWGGRYRHRDGLQANFGIDLLDGSRIAEGYCYFADAVKMLGHHLAEAGLK